MTMKPISSRPQDPASGKIKSPATVMKLESRSPEAMRSLAYGSKVISPGDDDACEWRSERSKLMHERRRKTLGASGSAGMLLHRTANQKSNGPRSFSSQPADANDLDLVSDVEQAMKSLVGPFTEYKKTTSSQNNPKTKQLEAQNKRPRLSHKMDPSLLDSPTAEAANEEETVHAACGLLLFAGAPGTDLERRGQAQGGEPATAAPHRSEEEAADRPWCVAACGVPPVCGGGRKGIWGWRLACGIPARARIRGQNCHPDASVSGLPRRTSLCNPHRISVPHLARFAQEFARRRLGNIVAPTWLLFTIKQMTGRASSPTPTTTPFRFLKDAEEKLSNRALAEEATRARRSPPPPAAMNRLQLDSMDPLLDSTTVLLNLMADGLDSTTGASPPVGEEAREEKVGPPGLSRDLLDISPQSALAGFQPAEQGQLLPTLPYIHHNERAHDPEKEPDVAGGAEQSRWAQRELEAVNSYCGSNREIRSLTLPLLRDGSFSASAAALVKRWKEIEVDDSLPDWAWKPCCKTGGPSEVSAQT
nr:unnamed protein product [Digitaria exilis]